MKISDDFGGLSELRGQKQGDLFICTFVSSQLNKVQQLAFVSFIYLRVKDFRDLVFRFSLENDWRFRGWSSIGKFIRGRGFQHGDMKNRVNIPHRVGEVEHEGDGADLGYNLKGA